MSAAAPTRSASKGRHLWLDVAAHLAKLAFAVCQQLLSLLPGREVVIDEGGKLGHLITQVVVVLTQLPRLALGATAIGSVPKLRLA